MEELNNRDVEMYYEDVVLKYVKDDDIDYQILENQKEFQGGNLKELATIVQAMEKQHDRRFMMEIDGYNGVVPMQEVDIVEIAEILDYEEEVDITYKSEDVEINISKNTYGDEKENLEVVLESDKLNTKEYIELDQTLQINGYMPKNKGMN